LFFRCLRLTDPIEVITAIIATMEAGGVFVPLDLKIAEARLELMIFESSPQWFVIDRRSEKDSTASPVETRE
jgi:hypothetical protein